MLWPLWLLCAANHTLIYTVRDPRAIFLSIATQESPSEVEKEQRWNNLIGNYLVWKKHLDSNHANILHIRFEDLSGLAIAAGDAADRPKFW